MPLERIDTLEKFRKLARESVNPETAQDKEKAERGELNWHCEDGKWFKLIGATPDEENFWMWRELIRFYQRDDEKQVIFLDEPWLDQLHFVHVSDGDPMKVAYTPNADKGRRDIQVVTTVGRYLTKHYSDKLTSDQIRELANKHRDKWLEQQVQFAETEEDCERVYTTGPGSCMSHKADHFGLDKHPARVYAGPDTMIAYLTRDKKVTARAVVNRGDKTYARYYGDALLAGKLHKLGYRQDSGALAGARLKLVAAKHGKYDVFLLPYIDGANQSVSVQTIDKKRYLVVGGDEDYDASLTTGFFSVDGTGGLETCSDCEYQYDEGDLTTVYRNRCVCDHCFENYVDAIVDYNGTRGYIHDEDAVRIEGEVYRDGLDFSRLGFEQDENGDWYTPSSEDEEEQAERAA